MSIYTKTGDKGKTSLLSGERVNKDCLALKAVGEVDELNAVLGIVVSELAGIDQFLRLNQFIQKTQNHLFRIGAELVSLQTDWAEKGDIKLIGVLHIRTLERIIDKVDPSLPPLQQFILPGGCRAGAFLHQARTVCRRAERSLVRLGKENELRAELYIYLNRLSDFLFVMARFVNFNMELEEIKVELKNK